MEKITKIMKSKINVTNVINFDSKIVETITQKGISPLKYSIQLWIYKLATDENKQ